MKVEISSDAELDLASGYCFYERQSRGVGDYFRESLIKDIDSLARFGGIHEVAFGYHRMLASRFPFAIYHQFANERVVVVAILDARRDPTWTHARLS